MLEKLLQKLTAQMIKNNIIPAQQRAVYHYSLEVALSLLSFWLMIIAFMLVFGSVWPTLLYLGVFFFFRSAIGGYHAKTHIRCLTLSAATYLTFIWSYTYLAKTWLAILLCSGLADITILLLAPVEHPNKPFSPSERMHYRKQSCYRIVLFLLFQITLAILKQPVTAAFCTAFGASQAALFMLIAYFQQIGGTTHERFDA